MKALVVYDSQYGNTEQVAKAIGAGLAGSGQVVVIRASEEALDKVKGVDLLIVGSPTQGGKPTASVQSFLAGLSSVDLKGVKAAAFDTRATSWVTKLFGYAGSRIGRALEAKGATLAVPAQAFYVKSTKGPLVDLETDRATAWGRTLAGR